MKRFFALFLALFLFSSCGGGSSLPFLSPSADKKVFSVTSVISEKTQNGQVVIPKIEKKGKGVLLQKDGKVAFVIPAHLWGDTYSLQSDICKDFQIPADNFPRKISQEDLLIFSFPVENAGKECVFEMSSQIFQKGAPLLHPSGNEFVVEEMLKTLLVEGKPLRGKIGQMANASSLGDSGLPFLDTDKKVLGILLATEGEKSFIMGLENVFPADPKAVSL